MEITISRKKEFYAAPVLEKKVIQATSGKFELKCNIDTYSEYTLGLIEIHSDKTQIYLSHNPGRDYKPLLSRDAYKAYKEFVSLCVSAVKKMNDELRANKEANQTSEQ